MDVSMCKRKFKQLFDEILKSNFEISDYHSDNLLKILEGSRNTRIGKILETPFFANLIILALNNFGSTSISVKVFIIKLTSIVLHNEVDFNRFHQMQGFELLVAKGREGYHRRSKALHVAYVRLLFAHVSHYSGVRFVMEHKAYKQILRPYTACVPPEVARGVYEFMVKLVWKLNEYDEETALLEALQFIVQPIVECAYYTTENINVESEKEISDMFVPNINILIALVDEIENVVEPNNVVPLLSRFFQVEAKLTLMLERTADEALAGLLAEACLRLRFAASCCATPPDRGAYVYVTEDLSLTFNKLLCTLINKKSVAVVLDFACRCHIFWHKVEAVTSPVSFERFGRQFQMRNQFIAVILVPIFMTQKAEEKLVADHELQEAIKDFTISLTEIVSTDMVKAAYGMRDLIMESGSTVAACTCSVRELARLHRQLSRRQAGIVFQALYYTLREYVLTDGAGELLLGANPLRTPEDVSLVAATLDAIDILLQEHEITWYESSEITNLQAALMNLIKQNILPTELLVRVVALATVSARKLLSPELALLLPSARGGSLQEMGATAAALLAHAACAVRVIALKLLQTLTEIAYVKFVSLRTVIQEHGLMAAAAHAALTDPETGVRAAALRCLASATRCECIWNELLSQYDNFYEQLVHMLQHDPEGEVRKEAANVLTHVFINHKVTRTFTVCVFKVMATAAIHDPHWEVKLATLDYWKEFTKSHFADRGVIDGRFPPVTFCKKKRKIITLTDKEIRNNIESAMDYLSSIGGFTVLLRCMNPCNHLEVIEKAYRFTSHFVEGIDKLFPAEPSISQIPTLVHDKDIEMTSNPLPQTPEVVDKDNSNHIDLFSEILESLGSDPAVEDPTDSVEIISPKEFLAIYRATDYKAIIESKKKTSADDLGTLIDELISPEYQLSPMLDS